ncbi:MAG TPA: hypothetical protein VNA65_00080 [Candidatus Dormibacteraeota bacterium]|nr:hypothetical protein [Candidatus Dormibacteraeota bacterium]
MTTLESVVGTLRRSSARSSAARYAVHAFFAGAAWVLLVVIAARLTPLEQWVRVAEYGIPVAFALAAAMWIAGRPSPMKLMRNADLRLGLNERLSTAWERRTADGPLDASLQRDALAHAARARLSSAYPLAVRRRELLLTGAIAVAAAALILLPNPMSAVIAQRHADQTAQRHAAATISTTQKKLAAKPSPPPVDPKVQQILQDTETKVAGAPNPRQALQSITPAEQQLLQLSDPQTPARASTASNLAASLSTTAAGQNASQALNASPAKGAQSIRQLASQLQSLTPEQRAEIAKALANAAQHAQDPQMASTLQQASSALARGDLSAASQSLNSLAGQLESLQQQENSDQEIASAINGLEAARQQLASQADRDAGGSQSTSAGGTSGAGASPSSGPGNGSGNSGSGNNQGTGTGTGNGSGAGNGGTGGVGNSGSGAGSGQGAAGTERVYVPGQPLPSESESDPTPLGPGQDVPMTPLTQVIQQYQQAALDVTGQSLIPGSERDLIRQYFSSLGETAQ